jgi:lipopolysaccharide/colanic/teichoic acid biosynthesis glycosyltransferase
MVKDASTLGPYYTSCDDPRITRVGRLIRRTSIDELPQLFNVLRGEMSLVGPRPEVPTQRSLYSEPDWALRCSVRPGITGLAQAKLRSAATWDQRLALDLQYVREAGLWLDLKILAWTLGLLTGRNAN